jgi:hypothetical protein
MRSCFFFSATWGRCNLPIGLPGGWAKSICAVASLDPKRYLGQKRPWPSASLQPRGRCYDDIFTSPVLACYISSLRLSCLLPLALMRVVERIVDLSR